MLDALPRADSLLGDWERMQHDTIPYRRRHKIENLLGRLKVWRRITRYDRCAHSFMYAICIATTIVYWLNQ
ncbi:hypothetical protein [Sphingobium scionense]|uniref:Transposase n=1 Tax=Sphingobium scionense TaxID=1404341 RepID=A0A7W6LTH9_9SPHN|nr:hypothetical protein [Sphingobium scionense]MBB4150066.1 transposase [Sphingobium scionense]